MVIGHFALAFAAKRAAPRTSLAVNFVAAQLADLLWPAFLLLGWEQVRIAPSGNPFLTLQFLRYPWSHSLEMDVLWAAAFGIVYYAITGYTRGAAIVPLLVISHWVLDLITHRPDLPLSPTGMARAGLGLWNYPAATIVVECALFAAGVAIYSRVTRPRDAVGKYAFWGLVAFLLALYAASIIAPPPQNVKALAAGALIGWPLTLFPWWVDRHRAS
ncbi:MAG TPA: hypothetical protein VL383_08320 [Gemmatimonadaceae bacterium]|nr:hypothetical protein [Gemmatimonadaceae bacterium]